MQDDSKPNLEYERDLWEMQARQRSFRRFQQIFQIYAVFGLLIGIVALAYFWLRQIQFDISREDQLILMFAGSGFAISGFSMLVLFLRQQKLRFQVDRNRYMVAAAEFLFQWARFENLSRAKLDAVGKEFNRMSIRAITSELVRSGIFTADDAMQLEDVLRFRNLLVHSGNSPDFDVINRMTETIKKFVTRVE